MEPSPQKVESSTIQQVRKLEPPAASFLTWTLVNQKEEQKKKRRFSWGISSKVIQKGPAMSGIGAQAIVFWSRLEGLD